VTVLEGESLINGATGIVAYRIAVAAIVLGKFSLWQAGVQFVVGAVGGIAVGLAMGWVAVWVRRHVADEPNVQNTISLLTPFATYLLAEEPSHWVWEQLGFPGEFAFSGVLAVVTAGLYRGRRGAVVISSETRLRAYAFWGFVTFLLNGVIFALIGIQLGGIVQRLSVTTSYSVVTLVFYGALISLDNSASTRCRVEPVRGPVMSPPNDGESVFDPVAVVAEALERRQHPLQAGPPRRRRTRGQSPPSCTA
jgi:NhaP-type Na+/H+ or K+/H+ antiporter